MGSASPPVPYLLLTYQDPSSLSCLKEGGGHRKEQRFRRGKALLGWHQANIPLNSGHSKCSKLMLSELGG